MTATWHLARKDLLLLWRDKLSFFWILGIPLIFGLFFGSIFAGQGPSRANPLQLVVVEPDGGLQAGAAAFVARLERSEALELKRLPRDQAIDAVRRGAAVAYIDVESAPASGGFDLFAFGPGGPMPQLEVGIDPSRQAEAGYLQGALMEASFGALAEVFEDPAQLVGRAREAIEQVAAQSDVPPAQRLLLQAMFRSMIALFESFEGDAVPFEAGLGGENIEFVPVARERRGPQNSFEISFPSAILWGVMGCAAAFAMTIVRERREGTLVRILAAPLTRAQVLLGKALACFVTCFLVIAVLIAFSALCFGVRLTDPLGLLAATACTSGCFVGLMMLLSVLGKTEQAASGIGWGVLVLMAMLGGSMVPLIAMPGWMRTLSDVSPVKWSILSLEGAIWRGFSPAEMLLPCGILLVIGGAGFALGWAILSRREA